MYYKGVLDSYMSCTPNVDMFGPTYFHVFLKEINDLCEEQVKLEKPDDPWRISLILYNFLILTDGSVESNKELETKEQIVRSSHLPISIIIVGIGKPVDDFKFMKKLDGDQDPLYSKKFIDNYSKSPKVEILVLICITTESPAKMGYLQISSKTMD